jgi:hypothetical protein
VKPLVEDAVSAALEPQNLQPRSSAICENEERSTFLWVLPNALAGCLSKSVEALPHIHRLSAHEDPDL